MRRGVGRAFAGWALAVGLLPLSAQEGEAQLRAFLEPAGEVSETRQLRLVIEVRSGEPVELAVPQLPPLDNLVVRGGPSSQREQSFSTVNGRFRQEYVNRLVYFLLPEGPGPASVPPIEVLVGGSKQRTSRLEVNVAEGPRGAPSNRQQAPAPTDGVPIFLEAVVDRDNVWAGQPITLEVRLYIRPGVTVRNFDFADQPGLSQFWSEPIEIARGEARLVTVGGEQYELHPLLRFVLVPSASGSVTIEPYTIELGVRARERGFFGSFRTVSVLRKSDPIRLEVKPLPTEGRPADFSGVTGSFELTVETDRTEGRVNDALALKATVSGAGFLRGGAAPRLEAPADLKIFDPKVISSRTRTAGGVRSTKTWEWLVVPLAPGELTLPELRFDFFDPESGAYRTLQRSAGTLSVRQGDFEVDGPRSAGRLRLEREEIEFIKPLRSGALSLGSPRLHQQGWFVALLLAPLVWAPLAILVSRRLAARRRNRGAMRSRRARQRARRSFARLGKRLDAEPAEPLHEGIGRTLIDYVADRFDRSPTGLTYDTVEELLGRAGVPAERVQAFRLMLEQCDFARYATGGDSGRERERLDEARRLVDAIEEAL